MPEPDVLIVGAGLAGLACACRLREVGISFQILEATDGIGGRVRTDVVDGFQLDRGFHALFPASLETQRLLDYRELELKHFARGVLIRYRGKFHYLVGPRGRLFASLKSLASPIGSFADKWRVLSLKAKVRAGKVEDQFAKPEGLTLDFLRWGGHFSDILIDRFFRPLGGALFLDRQLVTSSRLFRFIFRMITEGGGALPSAGIGAIPAQIAAALPADSIQLNTPAAAIEPGRVVLRRGETFSAKAIVLATDGQTAAQLLPERIPDPGARAVTCLYFAAPQSPLAEPLLVLDAEGVGPINHFAVPSDIAPSYAPPGQALLAASVLGDCPQDDVALEESVRRQLADWFGPIVHSWRHLRTVRIRNAIPDQTAPALDVPQRPVKLANGLYICGDHRDNATMDGALASGFRAAQAVAEGVAK